MKRQITSKRVAIALALATIPVLVGCGSSSSGTVAAVASGAYYSSGSCVPITQPIYFTGTGVNENSQTLVAGTLPASAGGQANGSITVGAAPISTGISGQTFYSNDMNSGPYPQYAYGDIAVTISGVTGTYYTSTGSLYGEITISPYEQSVIEQQFAGGTYGTTTTYGAVPCVSGVALQGYLDTTPSAPGFEGYAYVYLNNQPHGVVLQFSGVN